MHFVARLPRKLPQSVSLVELLMANERLDLSAPPRWLHMRTITQNVSSHHHAKSVNRPSGLPRKYARPVVR
ncbi:hypothetical protein BN2476_750112 [Paraburkholderia piptadeniae]|uniref:Uncharacterized protein n=1 Tax=Paraburkholderia piptadeniae TaxID=1701573 RepID=A0A1N7SRU5_9BURK|nr:hypothetical protein BN2476_750112 [Paraburkholderia piptadeniae]